MKTYDVLSMSACSPYSWAYTNDVMDWGSAAFLKYEKKNIRRKKNRKEAFPPPFPIFPSPQNKIKKKKKMKKCEYQFFFYLFSL